MHCHCHEMSVEELEDIFSRMPDLVVVAVSEDIESLLRTLELAELFPRLIPCAGLHPWSIRDNGVGEAEEIARLAARYGLECIGEVGLDRKFLPRRLWKIQVEVFRLFLRTARELGAYVTVHSPGAWRDSVRMIAEEGVWKAMLHWYTGPQDLVQVMAELGIGVSINPALRIQEKHRRIAEIVPLEALVLESDGPYNYKGLRLSPTMIPEAARIIAQLRGMSVETILEAARRNSERLLYS